MKNQLKLIIAAAFLCVPFFAKADGDEFQYHNPVIKTALPDPTVMRGPDGCFYLFSTEDIASDTADKTHNVPIYKSDNLVDWQFIGTAFTDTVHPSFLPNMNRVCAPDVNLINGKYVLYYSLSNWDHGTGTSTWDVQWLGHGVGVAVADRIEGPYKDLGKLFLSIDIGVQGSIDQFYYEEEDGSKWLFWGSYHGIYYIQLSDDGLSLKEGAVKTRVAGSFIEGTIIHKRDGYYYMIGSNGTCCNGLKATYHLVVARSKSLFGPYVDKNGLPAITNNFSDLQRGTKTIIGPGHCSEIIEDDAGQTWLMYHGYQADSWETGRISYLSQIMWDSEGWPYVPAEKAPSSWDRPLFGQKFTYSDAEYVEYTGGDGKYQFLYDTGYVPGKDTKVEVKCRTYAQDSAGKPTTNTRAVFAGNNTQSDGYELNVSTKFWNYSACGYINENIARHEFDTDYTILAERSSLTVNGQKFETDTSAYSGTTQRITLFSGSRRFFSGKLNSHPYCGRIYYLKIYEKDKLVREFRPCVRNEDGMPMFHELVTDTYIRPYDREGFSASPIK